MKWYSKIAAGISGIILASVGSSLIVQNRINNSIPPYIESNLERIMKRQEDRLKIKHFETPKIVYKEPSWLEGPMTTLGNYKPKEDETYLQLGSTITPEKSLINNMAIFLPFCPTYNVEKTLEHELGHFYMDKLSENLGRGSWPIFFDKQSMGDKIGIRLVAEGVAEYFRKSGSGEEDYFQDSYWPKKAEDFISNYILYYGGFHLVDPIIDIYGKQGIEYLITNPPKDTDLKNILGYQDRAMYSLSQSHPRLLLDWINTKL